MRPKPIRRPRTALAAALLLGFLAAGGCTSSGGGPSSANTKDALAGAQPFARLDPAAFAARMEDRDAVLINVHVPYEGELEDTHAFIPFHHIVGDARLPADKHAEVLLYCRSGRMSEIAGNALHAAGYTNLAHLEGGMRAWEAAGGRLLHNPAHASPADAGMAH
jgi:rhodanese-related sulfurtransferase